MAARVAFNCSASSAVSQFPSTIFPQSCQAFIPLCGANRSPGRSSRSSRANHERNSDYSICHLLIPLKGHSIPLPRKRLRLAAARPPGCRSRGGSSCHFEVLAVSCESNDAAASVAGAAAVRAARTLWTLETSQAKFPGNDIVRLRRRSKIGLIANAEKKKKGGLSFGDQLLDYIEGGPKLRRWYGAPDQIPKDGNTKQLQDIEEPAEEEEDIVRDAILVTDADSETGQLVVLELILRRLRVLALVKDIKAATVGFGAYVQPVEGDVNDRAILRKIIKSVRAIICPTKVGQLADQELVRGVEHLVLLSKLDVNRNQSGLGSLFGRRSKREAEENEAAVSALGIPYTIVRAGSLKDERGGDPGFRYGQDGIMDGTIRREDAAYVCAEALNSPPQRALVFEVVNGKEEVEEWSAVFASLKETTSEERIP